MIRLSEIKLPIETADGLKHSDELVTAAICKKLHIPATDIQDFTIFKRGVDARKSDKILYVYILHANLANEAKILAKFKKDPQVKEAPDTRYQPIKINSNYPTKNSNTDTELELAKANQGGERRESQIVQTVQQDSSIEANNELPRKAHARPIIIGFGPAGIFAALILAQAGLKPIVLERGKK